MSSKGSMSSANIQSSDDSSSHNNSAYSEPVTMRWRSDNVSSTKTESAKAKEAQTNLKTTEELLTPKFKAPIVRALITPPTKEQFVVPPKLSLNGLLSPCMGIEKQPNHVPDFKLPMLPALSFPLLSQEETAEVQPLSPLSGSSSSGHSGNQDDCYPS